MDSSVKQLKNLYLENPEYSSMYHFERAEDIHRIEIIQAYEQGYRDGQNGANLSRYNRDISQFSNAKDYFKNTFKK
jgi:hypothetical protein